MLSMKIKIILIIKLLIILECKAKLSLIQKRRCEQLINIFETQSKKNDYGFCENLNDGRGFTSGRSRFTTNSGEAYEVVKRYSNRRNDSPLNKYKKWLKFLSEMKSNDVSELSGYEIGWKRASNDPIFRKIQDDVNQDFYYK